MDKTNKHTAKRVGLGFGSFIVSRALGNALKYYAVPTVVAVNAPVVPKVVPVVTAALASLVTWKLGGKIEKSKPYRDAIAIGALLAFGEELLTIFYK